MPTSWAGDDRHDDEKMARGEACTFYRFVPGRSAEPLVSFHCRPAQREITTSTVLTIGCRGMQAAIDYQIAGDTKRTAFRRNKDAACRV
jgi:hypothetical protein